MPIIAFENTIPNDIARIPARASDLGFSERHAHHNDVATHLLHRLHALAAGQQLVTPFTEVDGSTRSYFQVYGKS